MNILSLDQASNKTGYSIWFNNKLQRHNVYDIHKIDKKHNGICYYDEKVKSLKEFVSKLIKENNIELVILENIQVQRNIKTVINLSYVQTVLRNYCYENKVGYSLLSPSQWRSILNIKGKKREDVKKNTQNYVLNNFGFDATEDEADSVCIGAAAIKLIKENKLEIFK